ncbi:MAG: DNA-directed RNA polymerase subunit P [Crenarchaeota archaeon]|nr:DNA-directed RNA polymerase subunit P [Thermoproteota archaeon]
MSSRKLYTCLRCGKSFSKEDLDTLSGMGVKCPFCGYRIIMKNRSPSAKRIKAR